MCVSDACENTGLDSAVFGTEAEAREAAEIVNEARGGAEAEVVSTDLAVNTTLAAWNEAGW
ncbi:MAG: hypothetical protein A2W31_06555 [Planctomycetes bacterium RBG_16_64_10]|nr:MAG: hypothetical protein A2W31_06555 [Planctomycetes bacterium RBG_16_64_10]